MIELKRFVENPLYNDDKEIITCYIIENNLEKEYIEVITRLVRSLTYKNEKKIEEKNEMMLYTLMNLNGLFSQYSTEIAQFLIELSLCYNIDDKDFSPKMIDRAKEIIPTIELPKCYYKEIIKCLSEKYGIKFKNHSDYFID